MLRDEILGVRIPHSRYSSALLHVQCVARYLTAVLHYFKIRKRCEHAAEAQLFSFLRLSQRSTDRTAWVGWELSFFSCLRKRISKVIDRLRVRNSPITASTGTRYTRCRVTLTSFPAYSDRSPEIKWRHSTLAPPRCSTRYSTRRKYQGSECRSVSCWSWTSSVRRRLVEHPNVFRRRYTDCFLLRYLDVFLHGRRISARSRNSSMSLTA